MGQQVQQWVGRRLTDQLLVMRLAVLKGDGAACPRLRAAGHKARRMCVRRREKALLRWCKLDFAFSSVQCCVCDFANHRIGCAFKYRLDGHWVRSVSEKLDGAFDSLMLIE